MTNIANQPWDMVTIVEAADSDGRIFRRGLRVGQIAPDGLTLEGSLHDVWLSTSPTGHELAGCLRDLANMIEGTTTLNEAKYRVDTRFPDGTWRPHSHNLRLSRAIGLMTAYHGEPWPCRVVNAQGNPVAYGPPPGEPDFVARGVADMRGDET